MATTQPGNMSLAVLTLIQNLQATNKGLVQEMLHDSRRQPSTTTTTLACPKLPPSQAFDHMVEPLSCYVARMEQRFRDYDLSAYMLVLKLMVAFLTAMGMLQLGPTVASKARRLWRRHLSIVAIVRLVRHRRRLPFNDFLTVSAQLLLLLGLVTYMLTGGQPAWEYGAMVLLIAAVLTKGTLKLRRVTDSSGILALLLGFFFHLPISLAQWEEMPAGEN